VRIARVQARSSGEQQINAGCAAIRSGAMERRFAAGAAITHEAAGLSPRKGCGVGIGPGGKKDLKDSIAGRAIRRGQGRVDTGAVLDQKSGSSTQAVGCSTATPLARYR